MERPSGNFSSGEQFFQWAVGNGWRTNWIRVGKIARIHRIGDSSQNSMRYGEFPHWTGTIQWSNPFYVHLQWHRHQQHRLWGCLHLDIWQSSTICIKICERTLGIHWPGHEEKWFRGYNYKPDGKWDSIASRMVKDFEETGHPVFKGISALNRGIMRRKKSKDTIHYNGESSNVELLYRIIHSANQLCIYGAVTNWCETLGRTESEKRNNSGKELTSHLLNNHDVNTEEIGSLVKIPRTLIASGNRTHQIISSFESFSPRSPLKYLYQRAGFYDPVWFARYHVTLPDIDDGKGNLIPMCREYTHPHEYYYSRCFATIKEIPKLDQSWTCKCQTYVVFNVLRYKSTESFFKG